MEKIKLEQKEIAHEYTLPNKNIISCGYDSEIRKENKEYFIGLLEEGIDWPVEIQGSGESDYNKKEFKVWYPAGDIFLSSAVTIHELGHLRQGEIDERFADEVLGAPKFKKGSENINYHDCEKDAWQRGLSRVKKYCSENLLSIEEKFQEYKKKGKFKEYNNFEDFFNHIVKIGLKITEFNDRVEDSSKDNKKVKGKLIGKMIKEDNLTNRFFTQQDEWRTGEIVDKGTTEDFIKKVAKKVAKEKY